MTASNIQAENADLKAKISKLQSLINSTLQSNAQLKAELAELKRLLIIQK